jgi:DNA helicase-2/ATP-dependent DNA helicase PcrA
LLNFKFNYRNSRILKLERNYRSSEEIVKAARSFVNRCTGRYEKNMTSERGTVTPVKVIEVPTRMDQYDKAHEIIRAHGDVGALAVIYRDNESGIPLIDQLDRGGVRFRLLAKANTFFTSRVARDIRAFMRLAQNPNDEKAFKRIYYKAERYIAKNDAKWACTNARRDSIAITEALVNQMSSYRKASRVRTDTQMARRFSSLIEDIAELSPLAAIDRIMTGGYRDWLDGNDAAMHRVDILRRLSAGEETTSSFISRLDRLNTICSKDPNEDQADSIVLTTAHSSKGREFDRVLIIDAVDGTFPSARASATDKSKDAARNYQEERRLFYVAMTRAKDELMLMRPHSDDTPFVDEVVPRPPDDGAKMSTTRRNDSGHL